MAKKEKFGKFVLLEEIDASGLGTEYRAAKLGPTGFEKIVTVLRLTPALSANAEGVKLLMDQVKFAAQLQNPNVIKILGIGGKVGTPCWVSYEFFDGKNLKAVFNRCRQEGLPFSVDHALLIASKLSAALEYAHARKTETGGRYFHGLVTPANVLVSYEGEVRLRGFGYWPARVRELGAVSAEDALYLAPEQAAGGGGDPKSDTFSVGALLFAMLTGQPLQEPGKPFDPSRVTGAKLLSPTTDDDAIPKPIRDILRRSLAADPAARYAEIHEMRKAVDALLFAGDFTPTTFNLAFFMHSLFREDIDRETNTLKDEREDTYGEFLIEEPARPPWPPAAPAPSTAPAPSAMPAPAVVPPRPAAAPVAPSAARPVAASAAAPVAAATRAPVSSEAVRPREQPPAPPVAPPVLTPVAAPVATPLAPPVASPVVPPETQPFVPPASPRERDAAARFTFHKGVAAGSKLPLFAGIGVLLLALGAGVLYLVGRRGSEAPAAAASAAPMSTLAPETAAAMAKVKELEDKLAAIEAEKAAATAKAEEDARKKMEAQAAARGQAVDPAALQRAQDEARRRSEAEQARKQQEEKKRLEDEQKAAEVLLAEERRKQEEARIAAAATAATTLPPATQPPAPPPTAPALKPGTLVQLSDAGVIAPVPLATPALQYPPIALARRIEGKVEVSVLVDERGIVTEARLDTAAGGKAGLNEAAIANARRRRYRPATKDGVPVKVWVPVTVNFILPK